MITANALTQYFKSYNFCVLILFILFGNYGFAQSWSIPAKSGSLAIRSVVYVESAYQNPSKPNGLKDTISGTAFLISDSAKIYLVTAKHIIQSDLFKTNQQLANDSIYVTASSKNDDKGIKLKGLSHWPTNSSPVVFSSDKEDLAIISLQKSEYKDVIAELLKKGCRPIPIELINGSNDHHIDDNLVHSFYLTFNNAGLKNRNKGLRPAKIVAFDPKQPSFIIGDFFNQANNGSPVFKDDKLIGVLSNEVEINTNADILNNPFKTSVTAKVIKASYLIPLLKKIQQIETN